MDTCLSAHTNNVRIHTNRGYILISTHIYHGYTNASTHLHAEHGEAPAEGAVGARVAAGDDPHHLARNKNQSGAASETNPFVGDSKRVGDSSTPRHQQTNRHTNQPTNLEINQPIDLKVN